jgi:endonuclease/exonuclease/phosphatase family metal-dependent hydrolase
MTKIRIGTFNAENLFARYDFNKELDPLSLNGFSINELAFDIAGEAAKTITAEAIKDTKADILCLQEIESLEVLDRFCTRYLNDKGYLYKTLIDSHDLRHIDVAFISKFPVVSINTHRHERNAKNNSWLFSRDLLEVVFSINGILLTVYINHFKSMIGGREETRSRRMEQVDRVAEVIDNVWADGNYVGNYIILGDFNDYIDNATSLKNLTDHPFLENVVERLPVEERWTHYYKGKKEYRQLDFLLVPKPLSQSVKNMNTMPVIIRKGLPLRAIKYIGERYEGVGMDNPKASDHCPLCFDLELL